jgi:hypothetical protein
LTKNFPTIIADSPLRKGDRQIKSHQYSAQVPNIVYDARRAALHELAEGIIHGTDHLETMLLIDISGSMTWNPHGGMMGKHSCLVLLVSPIVVSPGWFLETKSHRFFRKAASGVSELLLFHFSHSNLRIGVNIN